MFDWVAKIAMKKALGKGLKGGLAAFAAGITALHQFGITIEINQAVLASAITGGVLGLYEFFRNWAKSKEINLP